MAEPTTKLVTAAKAAATKEPGSREPLVTAAHSLGDTVHNLLNTASSVLPSSGTISPEEKAKVWNWLHRLIFFCSTIICAPLPRLLDQQPQT